MNYVPTASQRKAMRARQNQQLYPVHPEGSEEEWKLLIDDKIFFWIWSLSGISSAEARSKYFIFHTKDDLGYYNVHKRLKTKFPEWKIDRWSPFKYGRNTSLPIPYFLAHAVEITTPESITWLEIMEKVTCCLQPVL